jgi:hypothetical protein
MVHGQVRWLKGVLEGSSHVVWRTRVRYANKLTPEAKRFKGVRQRRVSSGGAGSNRYCYPAQHEKLCPVSIAFCMVRIVWRSSSTDRTYIQMAAPSDLKQQCRERCDPSELAWRLSSKHFKRRKVFSAATRTYVLRRRPRWTTRTMC